MTEKSRTFCLLLVEDNRGDIDLVREALRTIPLSIDLQTVQDGEEALHYLRKRNKHSAATTPDLVFLDLNLPKKDGREVLVDLKQDVSLKRIPVVVLTSSEAADDILNAYALGANCYVTKPFSLDEFINQVQKMVQFWLVTATLPPSN